MSCSEGSTNQVDIDDQVAAAAFRRLVAHLQHRTDAQNIDLMGLAGFCRNCLADWVADASAGKLDREEVRSAIYGMPYESWKTLHQAEATPGQLARLRASVDLNARHSSVS
ncbi:MAG: DUF1244 domain-containing protein [Pseudomonadota bacterium]